MGVGTLAAVEPRSSWAHTMRATLQTVSALENFRRCGKQWANEVRVVMAPTGETRRLGIHYCSNVHICPVCWSRRRIQERGELIFAGEQWLAAGGGLAAMVLTVPHAPEEALTVVQDRLSSWASVLRHGEGRRQLRESFGVEAILRATETTWNPMAGWHPHDHLWLWLAEPMSEPIQDGLWRWIKERWRRREKIPTDPGGGGMWLPKDVKPIEPAEVPTAAGHITKGGSRSTEERYWKAKEAGNEKLAAYLAPFAFGEEAAGAGPGAPAAFAAWREYEAAVAGSQWIRWPNGWRARFGLGKAGKAPALDGEEIARYGRTAAVRDLS